jgi:hypothetical protein
MNLFLKIGYIAYVVRDLDGVNKALSGETVTHVADNCVSVYLRDLVENIGVEYCNGHNCIPDASYRGRLNKAGRTAWSSGFPDRAPIEPPEALAAAAIGHDGGTAAALVGPAR